MHWMIDGVYGDLYRTAMGYRQLKPHEESENCQPSPPGFNHTMARSILALAARLVSDAKRLVHTLSSVKATKPPSQRPLLHTK